jgi:hypothetical protein
MDIDQTKEEYNRNYIKDYFQHGYPWSNMCGPLSHEAEIHLNSKETGKTMFIFNVKELLDEIKQENPSFSIPWLGI